MPCRQDFLDSPKTSSKIKTKAMQCIIDRTRRLHELKPAGEGFCRVVCAISLPCLWGSQIIVFFDKNYYNNFFERNSSYQKWASLPKTSMKQLRNLELGPEFSEKYYFEEITEYNEVHTQHLWFYGELSGPA